MECVQQAFRFRSLTSGQLHFCLFHETVVHVLLVWCECCVLSCCEVRLLRKSAFVVVLFFFNVFLFFEENVYWHNSCALSRLFVMVLIIKLKKKRCSWMRVSEWLCCTYVELKTSVLWVCFRHSFNWSVLQFNGQHKCKVCLIHV